MDGLSGRNVFSVGSRVFSWDDVLFAALAWGEWAPILAATRHGLGVLRASSNPPSAAELTRAAQEFRYARRLITGEEAEAWLTRWGLSAEQWRAHLRRRLCQERTVNASAVGADAVREDEVEACALVDAILSGQLERLAHSLATRAALHDKLREENTAPLEADPADRSRFETQTAAPAAMPVLPAYSDERRRESLDLLAAYEADLRTFRDQLAHSEAIQAEIRSRYLSWIRVHVRSVCVGDADRAWEIVHAMMQDGQALTDVAAAACVPVEEVEVLLEDLAPAAQDRLRGARVGDLIGPLQSESGSTVMHLIGRSAPEPSVPEVRERALRVVLARELRQCAELRVSWHWPVGEWL